MRGRGRRALAAAALWLAAQAACALPLTAGVEWIPGRFDPGEQPDGNSVILEGPAGLVLLDTGRHPAHAAAVIARVKEIGKPLQWIVNSHWHLDHIGGNAAVRAAFPGAKLLASDAVVAARGGFLARYRADLAGAIASAPAGSAEVPGWRREIEIIDNTAAQTPDEFVTASTTRTLAGRQVQVHLESQAVTAGDVWLFDEASKVLAAGDLVTLPAPFLDTACAPRWQQALDSLAAQPFEWLIPGHGAPMRRAGFERYRQAFSDLRRCAASEAAKDACVEGWLSTVGDLVPPGEQKAARGMLGYYIDQHLRSENASKANCPK